MRGSVESPFEPQLQETVAMELNTGAPYMALCGQFKPSLDPL